MLHCHDGEVDCQDVPYIFSVRMSVSHEVLFRENGKYFGERVINDLGSREQRGYFRPGAQTSPLTEPQKVRVSDL